MPGRYVRGMNRMRDTIENFLSENHISFDTTSNGMYELDLGQNGTIVAPLSHTAPVQRHRDYCAQMANNGIPVVDMFLHTEGDFLRYFTPDQAFKKANKSLKNYPLNPPHGDKTQHYIFGMIKARDLEKWHKEEGKSSIYYNPKTPEGQNPFSNIKLLPVELDYTHKSEYIQNKFGTTATAKTYAFAREIPEHPFFEQVRKIGEDRRLTLEALAREDEKLGPVGKEMKILKAGGIPSWHNQPEKRT